MNESEEQTTFDLDEAIAVLERTPAILRAWLSGLPPAWIEADEGPESWNAFDIVGHLIHGERTDWIARVMAKRYRSEVGAWGAYLPVLRDREVDSEAGS